ncbi:MAG: efflux RND transporter permease subunit [Gammaproteobacteria bacterium]|uniref:efflux RND transporter permease subunit n=1 Tax=Shewanella sp. Pdp11 TaxID=2059264 RepID=UPI000CA1438C|nr:efflux RND transporter permease subunit [Shewanella sp. Pdp11]EGT3625161.1 efflux RND transporter permease subunit [Morganella morganii]MBU1391856.1 efflux RND transporter permease subunit [Gammaproteobacteria bacterium]AUD61619.1 acriflavin resistance protein [Shewanella sp. Pdp11]MBU1476552.1 efflux RND transporter permease subunit [Gammaproteobacteria bacterium]MBU2000076.1 efflux RND transporter permease subunit [Gammaproteobacteria bacterium]
MDTQKGILAWFARNSVAANLLMWALLVGGLFSTVLINKEVFPSFELNLLNISVAYPGAAPQEIEEGINIKIEEAIQDINGIKKVTSVASEGVGSITVEVEDGYEVQTVLDEAKLRLDAISTFPVNIEKPNIYQIKPENNVIWVSVYGDMTLHDMKELAKSVRDDLTQLPAVTRAKVTGVRDYEIGIEVSENKLREYGLTFSQVALAVQNSSFDLPGGSIRAQDGDILLRTKGQAYTGDDFANIVVTTRPDGSRVMLPQVATIKDDFEERLEYTRFNGKPAAIIEVTSVDDQNALDIAAQVKQYVEDRRATLPANAQLDTWGDMTHYLKGRLNMMMSNMFYGALLVFIILALFLDLKLAFWVMMGLPVCFLGTMLIMPLEPFSMTINMLTLFAFILVLGIVVDDAIVIGESAYTEVERHGHSVENVIRGAQKVAMPATFGVLTTIAAFIPMLMVSGPMGIIWKSIGMVVILCLAFSLVESKFILPAHLAHMKFKKPGAPRGFFGRLKANFNDRVQHFIHHSYRNFLERCIKQRYNVVAAFIGVLVLSIALVASGKVRWVFFPDIPSDFIQVQLEMDEGSSEDNTLKVVQSIEEALYKMNDKMEQDNGYQVVKHSFINMSSRTSAFIFAELTKGEDREVDGVTIAAAWREQLPELLSVKKLSFNASTNDAGGDISFRLTSSDLDELSAASKELKQKLASYEGVYDIADNFSSGSHEIRLKIRPEAEALGLTLSDLARQVRYGFYGYEAQRILRNKEEIKVMVRYPLEQRRTVGYLENMLIRTPTGTSVPFSTVAQIEKGESYASITRVDGKRAITITANANKNIVEPSKVVQEIQKDYLPQLQAKYPKIQTALDGGSLDEQNAMVGLLQGFFFALFTIYALMAIPLKSYSQPLIIMSVIPFGIIGALFGHLIQGLAMSVLSLCGIVALAGVVVNDSLILVDFVNRAREQGQSVRQAAVDSGCYRFRAIILTSLTTFVGLVPIILERSLQAQIVIPMATSLAFGILFSTVVTLILVPLLYIILDDVSRSSSRFFNWWWQPKKTNDEDVKHPDFEQAVTTDYKKDYL